MNMFVGKFKLQKNSSWQGLYKNSIHPVPF
jgi:hypothetical protein